MQDRDIKALIVSRDAALRRVVSAALCEIGGIEPAEFLPSGNLLQARLQRNDVALVIMDVEILAGDVLGMVESIRRDHSGTGLILLGFGENSNSSDFSIDVPCLLDLGVLDFVQIPLSNSDENKEVKSFQRLLGPLIGLHRGRMRSVGTGLSGMGKGFPLNDSRVGGNKSKELPASEGQNDSTFNCKEVNAVSGLALIQAVAVGASTGGPEALKEFLGNLPGDLGVPFFLVQHAPRDLTQMLVKNWGMNSALTVKVASDGEIVCPNTVYAAPGGRHLTVKKGDGNSGSKILMLSDAPPENSCRPSVDVLFRSLSNLYSGTILTLIMTGMGADGVKGVAELKRTGRCYCLTQSEESCAVYGMPRSVCEAGLSDEQATLKGLAGRVAGLIMNGR